MRCWIAIALLTGCYRPSASLCADCDGGVDDDASDGALPEDGSPDSTPPLEACVSSQFPLDPTVPILMIGTSFTTDGVIAIYDDKTITPTRLRETKLANPDAGTPLAFIAAPSIFTPAHPRLAPDGGDLFFLGTDGSRDAALLRSRRVGDEWSQPAEVAVEVLDGSLVTPSFRPGVPSSTTPRFMVASNTTSTTLLVGREAILGGKWTFEPLLFAGFTFAAEPYLSSDGRALLFVGANGMGVQIYRATRVDLDSAFGIPVALHDINNPMGGNPETPAMTPDCTTLLWTNNDTNGVYRHD